MDCAVAILNGIIMGESSCNACDFDVVGSADYNICQSYDLKSQFGIQSLPAIVVAETVAVPRPEAM